MALEIAVLAAGAAYAGGVFVYEEPAEGDGRLRPGHLVLVPFGREGRPEPGVVLRRAAANGRPRRAVLRLVAEQPVLDPIHLEWASWLSRNYLAPLNECLRLMVPLGLTPRREACYERTLPDRPLARPVAVSFAEQILLDALAEGPLTHSQVHAVLRDFPLAERRRALQRLLQRGWIRRGWRIGERRPPLIRLVRLVQAPTPGFRLGRTRAIEERRRRILDRLQEAGRPLPVDAVRAELSLIHI